MTQPQPETAPRTFPDVYIHDTLQRRKVKFEATSAGRVGMYLCGPTGIPTRTWVMPRRKSPST